MNLQHIRYNICKDNVSYLGKQRPFEKSYFFFFPKRDVIINLIPVKPKNTAKTMIISPKDKTG